jgi:chorismate mutase
MDKVLEQNVKSIADALNDRFKHCRTIGRMKAIYGLPTLKKTVEDDVKRRARATFTGEGQLIDELFDHILIHSRSLQDYVRDTFEDAGAKAGQDAVDDAVSQINEQRNTVQQADTTLVKLLNEFRERRASSENGAENSPEIADALLNALDTPDDARFDDELRAISERIAALS